MPVEPPVMMAVFPWRSFREAILLCWWVGIKAGERGDEGIWREESVEMKRREDKTKSREEIERQ